MFNKQKVIYAHIIFPVILKSGAINVTTVNTAKGTAPIRKYGLPCPPAPLSLPALSAVEGSKGRRKSHFEESLTFKLCTKVNKQ